MSSGYAGHQRHRNHNNVLFTKTIKISRASQRNFEETEIAKQMALASFSQLEPIVFDNNLYRQPMRLIRQGRLGSSGILQCARDLARHNRYRRRRD